MQRVTLATKNLPKEPGLQEAKTNKKLAAELEDQDANLEEQEQLEPEQEEEEEPTAPDDDDDDDDDDAATPATAATAVARPSKAPRYG